MALIQWLLFILVPLAGQAQNRVVLRAGPWAKCQAQARARGRAVPGTGTGMGCAFLGRAFQCRAWAGPACSAQLENFTPGCLPGLKCSDHLACYTARHNLSSLNWFLVILNHY